MTKSADTDDRLIAPAEDHPVTKVVAEVDHMVDSGDIKVADLIRHFGDAAFAPLIMIPGLLLVSPLSGFPLFSTLCGSVIFLVAVQGALGRDQIWLPGFLMRMQLEDNLAHRATASLSRASRIVDRVTRQRLHLLVSAGPRRGLYLICALAALCFPLLEFVIFSSSIMGGGIALIAVAILARDGVFVVAGLLSMTIAAAIPVALVGTLTAAF